MKFKKLENGEWEARIKRLDGSISVTGATMEEAQERMLMLLGDRAHD